MSIESGQKIRADDVMNAMGSLFNDTAQNIFNHDYIGFDSLLHGDGIPQYKNTLYSTFTSDDASTNTGFVYDVVNDNYMLTYSATTQNRNGYTGVLTGNSGGYFDNFYISSDLILSNKEQCKEEGWRIFINPTFNNQGECVSYLEQNSNK